MIDQRNTMLTHFFFGLITKPTYPVLKMVNLTLQILSKMSILVVAQQNPGVVIVYGAWTGTVLE